MNISTRIKPLYDDLIKQHFLDYLNDYQNEFTRLCNDLKVTDEYTKAFNETVKLGSGQKNYFDFGYFDHSQFLAHLLNELYDHRNDIFCVTITEFLVHFLSCTQSIVNINQLILDLKSLEINDRELNYLLKAFRKYDENYRLKVLTLKNHLIMRATGGGSDDGEYIYLRNFLLSRSAIKKLLPDFVVKYQDLNAFWNFIKPSVLGYAPRREFINESFIPLFNFLDQSENVIADSIVIDNSYVNEVWAKALERVNSDPEAAITTARTLIETVCKHILDETNTQYKDGVEMPTLYKLTANILNLSPDQHTEEMFKQILGGGQSVIHGLGSIRNKISDAHGISQKRAKPSKRHGLLAVNLSGAMSQFLLQSYEAKS